MLPSYSPLPPVEKLWRTTAFQNAAPGHGRSCSLIEQSKRSGLKRFAESTTGIIPGDRGKVGDSWCRPPLACGNARCRQISPAPLAGVVTGQFSTNQELSGKTRLETVFEPSQVYRTFRPADRRSYPEGYGCYCADQNAVAHPGGTTPAKRPGFARSGARKGGVAARSERAWQSPSTSSWGGVKYHITLLQSERSLRVKRSDP